MFLDCGVKGIYGGRVEMRGKSAGRRDLMWENSKCRVRRYATSLALEKARTTGKAS